MHIYILSISYHTDVYKSCFFVLIFEVVISVVGLQFYVLVCILKRDIIPIYIYIIIYTDTGEKDELLLPRLYFYIMMH